MNKDKDKDKLLKEIEIRKRNKVYNIKHNKYCADYTPRHTEVYKYKGDLVSIPLSTTNTSTPKKKEQEYKQEDQVFKYY